MCLRPSGAVDPVGPKLGASGSKTRGYRRASPQSLRPGPLFLIVRAGATTGCLERNLYGWTGPVLTDRRCKDWLGWRLVEGGRSAKREPTGSTTRGLLTFTVVLYQAAR
jgi:hypothetical protein